MTVKVSERAKYNRNKIADTFITSSIFFYFLPDMREISCLAFFIYIIGY